MIERKDTSEVHAAGPTLSEGIALFEQGRFGEAQQVLKQVLSTTSVHEDPTHVGFVEGALGAIYLALGEYQLAHPLIVQAKDAFTKNGLVWQAAQQMVNLGCLHRSIASHATAIGYFESALKAADDIRFKRLVPFIYTNLSSVYVDLGDYETALRYCSMGAQALSSIDSPVDYGSALVNLASIYNKLGRVGEGIACICKAILTLRVNNSTFYLSSTYHVLGSLYRTLGNYPASLVALNAGYHYATAHSNQEDKAKILQDLGELALKRGELLFNATQLLENALTIYENLGLKTDLMFVCESLFDAYLATEQYKSAAELAVRLRTVENSVRNAKVLALAKVGDYERAIAKREQELQTEHLLRETTEGVLKSMLPTRVADKLIRKESVAEHFESVSVLFADIVDFTSLAELLAPDILTDFLNAVFSHFDAILDRYGCERLKTVGDGYIALCGMTPPFENHAYRISRAAMEMMSDFFLPDSVTLRMPIEKADLSIRIGIHTGPVTAGMVGVNRMQYDVYGDTVNVAARMESHGEPDRIQCSPAHYDAVMRCNLTDEEMACMRFVPRGPVHVKGKGTMHTYWLDVERADE